MKTIYYAMEEGHLSRFLKTKTEILETAKTMSTAERISARAEIIEAATVFDIPEGSFDGRELYSVVGGVATIPVSGKLTPEVDVCDGFFSDVTTYRFIEHAALAADDDPAVESINFDFSTGGGSVSGLDRAGRVLAGLKKPTTGNVFGMCASAGYWLASQLDTIVATSPTDFLGSIGVAVEIIDRTKREEAAGIKRISLTSTDAPDKRLDLATDDGQNKVIAELDALHNVFASRIQSGRGTTRAAIDKDFGKGGLLIAEEALRVGMIDKVAGAEQAAFIETETPAAAGQPIKEEQQMATLKELLSKDPAAQAEFDTELATARAKGVADVQATIKKVSPFLSNSEYPEIIGTTALNVLNGESAMVELTGAVAAVDAVRQDQASKKAAATTDEQSETNDSGKPPVASDGSMASAADVDAEVARIKGEA